MSVRDNELMSQGNAQSGQVAQQRCVRLVHRETDNIEWDPQEAGRRVQNVPEAIERTNARQVLSIEQRLSEPEERKWSVCAKSEQGNK